jgi:hypothetical protein
MTNHKDEANDKTLIKAGEGFIKAVQNIASQVDTTRRLQDAYEGKCTFEGHELEGEIDALKAIAARCNAPSDSIYAELLKVVSFVHELRNEVDKAKRREQSAKKVKRERRKAARARKVEEKIQERNGAEPLLKFLSGE